MVVLLGRFDYGMDDSTNRTGTEAVSLHNQVLGRVCRQAAHAHKNDRKKKYSINRILDIDNIRNR
jgi:hypothetical protein